MKREKMTREKVIAAIQACARKLKRPPSRAELKQSKGISPGQVKWLFRDMGRAIRAAGFEHRGSGHRIRTADLLLDWAELTRKLRRLPGSGWYARTGKYSVIPFIKRYGSWQAVPAAFEELAGQTGTEAEWRDVLELIRAKADGKARGSKKPNSKRLTDAGRTEHSAFAMTPFSNTPFSSTSLSNTPFPETHEKLLPSRNCFRDRPVAGPPIDVDGLAHEPVNELGVVFFFGMFAHALGFRVISFQPGFPDCEAMREVRPGKWQRVRIEFEYESRNFRKHRHSHKGCDVIVCWRHNWKECPRDLEVIELSRLVA